MRARQRALGRKAGQGGGGHGSVSPGWGAGGGRFQLDNTVAPESNVVIVQVTGEAPFSVDFILRPAGQGEEDNNSAQSAQSPAEQTEAKPEPQKHVDSKAVTQWLSAGSSAFTSRFEGVFGLQGKKGFGSQDVAAAKAALSNLLGGTGYFSGRSQIRGKLESFEGSLFTAVPSRTFFPRGFLWDEGFHQLLVSTWDRSISVDVLGHWLGLMHVHGSRDAGEGESSQGGKWGGKCPGGWIPREQILGEEARRRVPEEFVAQDVNVANPPTLLLLVEHLLKDMATRSGEEGRGTGTRRVIQARTGDGGGGEGDRLKLPLPLDPGGLMEVCENTQGARGGGRSSGSGECTAPEFSSTLLDFLRQAHPLLDQWLRWLLVTQRPGGVGGGGGGRRERSWRGRDHRDGRLNALTLASGLDDFPRASHPSETSEWHVDALCWLALGCRVMDKLSALVGADLEAPLPYGEIFQELLGRLEELHWDEVHHAFLDYGVHASQGHLATEVVVRCQGAGRETLDVGNPLELVLSRQYECPKGYHPIFPLGDGRGGLLTRQRWQGGEAHPQLVPHIGYVSIFPLLLKLLPPDSPHLGDLLRLTRDPVHLWSPHGLRSLSASDPLYQVPNNPGDEPYWRGHIWININFLAIAALWHYSVVDGPYREEARGCYRELRGNVMRTVLGEYHRTGFLWEQYDDISGHGRRSHPFSGWTALVVNIMAEIY
ncbi:unnamed protein product [Discosporangium mesarthrocarpum]